MTGHTGLAVGAIMLAIGACAAEVGDTPSPADFVGRETCAGCHMREDSLWQGSHHDLAMQIADSTTVLGDFGDATLTHAGVSSTFYSRDDGFFVRTDGADGELTEYEIAYTFGVDPLQQYLIAFPGGRYQALGIAWDTRPVDDGGQRWFHLYPEEKIDHDDALHWTGREQNWNYQCAECHSTDLRKNYRVESDTYETTWAELDVACEACHGPGSHHVAWAEPGERSDPPYEGSLGLVVALDERRGASWVHDPETGIARRTPILTRRSELDVCARCHARRAVVTEAYAYGRPLGDTHMPTLLTEALYHADGQILDEVYVYGSFLQSRMYGAGVTCSDCHEPHSATLRADGNGVCATCHAPARYDTPDHHFHEPGATGSSCAGCHMPSRTYMVVDPRHDHSFRVPRPDLSVDLGTPSACTACHADRTDAWAAGVVEAWYPGGRSQQGHYGVVIDAARRGLPVASTSLVRLATDGSAPPIVRATALSMLPGFPAVGAAGAVRAALADPDPLVRIGALRAVAFIDARDRPGVAGLSLRDAVATVRMEAASVLAAVPRELLTAEQAAAFDRAAREYVRGQLAIAERPEARANLGVFYARLGDLDRAVREFRAALGLSPEFAPAYVNLADLYRVQGLESEAEQVLREGLLVNPDEAALHHALGLALVRLGRTEEAIDPLERAARLSPEVARYAYVLGVALDSTGRVDSALAELQAASERHPYDTDILFALASFSLSAGRQDDALVYAGQLAQIAPMDPQVQALLSQIRQGAP